MLNANVNMSIVKLMNNNAVKHFLQKMKFDNTGYY